MDAYRPEPMQLGALLESAAERAPELFVGSTLLGAQTRDLLQITGVAQDHRRVERGALFVARRGARVDGHDHLAAAVAAGAVALVGDRPVAEVGALGAPYVQVSDARRAVAFLAAAFHRHPSERVRVLGITGTDGKTTTSYLLHWLLLGRFEAALSSTAGLFLGATELAPEEGHFTTPEATEVQALLARYAAGGASHVVLESSSHGFALARLESVRYELGVFTNLSPEHLDHHGTLEAYREAKATLLRRAPLGVVNRDDEAYGYFAAAAKEHVSYGEHPEADVRLLAVDQGTGGLRLELDVHGERLEAQLAMVGRYNAHNAAAALAAAVAEGMTPTEAAARLATFPGVPGRMQLVGTEVGTGPTVIVDFAHTAPALAKALAAVRLPGSRLIVVIGSAGERDPGKRAPLGKAAVEGADLAVFTEEDSRSESVDAILTRMAEGAVGAGGVQGRDFVLEPDRAKAIRLAVAAARPGDVVLLAGKGHERTLERAAVALPWNEADEARRALAERS